MIIQILTGFLELTPYSENIVRVRYAPTQAFSTRKSLMIESTASKSTAIDVNETAEALVFSTPKLSIQVNRQTGAFTYLDKSGQILTKEPDRGGKTLVPTDVIKSVFD